MSVVIGSATSSLGSYLTNPSGLTLYTHTGDSATSSTCIGQCAVAWPPVLVATGGAATAGTGVTGTFATLTRADGTVQVTYQGLPLYGWKGDAKPGDATGEGVNGFLVATLGGPVPVPSSTGKPGY
jgi:predicted lipoprotein with Yx(FWY)xxD motif